MRVSLTQTPCQGRYSKIFHQAAIIPISPNTGGIRNYLGTRLDRDDKPEAMSDGLWADVVRIILENIFDLCLGAISTLLGMNTYEGWCIDSSLLCETPTSFRRSRFSGRLNR